MKEFCSLLKIAWVCDSLYPFIWYFSVAELFYSHVEVYQVLLREETTLNFQSREQHLYMRIMNENSL